MRAGAVVVAKQESARGYRCLVRVSLMESSIHAHVDTSEFSERQLAPIFGNVPCDVTTVQDVDRWLRAVCDKAAVCSEHKE